MISQAIRNLLDGDIAIPHALEVEGQIVRLFDPVNHDALPLPEGDGLADDAAPDRRWVRCRRPLVTVGGELTLDSLELSYNPTSGLLPRAGAGGGERRRAGHRRLRPPAGRAAAVPQPLDRAAREPRRLTSRCRPARSSSCRLPCCSSSRRTCGPRRSSTRRSSGGFTTRCSRRARRSRSSATIFERLLPEARRALRRRARRQACSRDFFEPRGIPLRGCHPRDLIDQALSLAEYLGEPRRLTPELLQAACAGYFVEDEEPAPVYA